MAVTATLVEQFYDRHHYVLSYLLLLSLLHAHLSLFQALPRQLNTQRIRSAIKTPKRIEQRLVLSFGVCTCARKSWGEQPSG